MKCVHVLQRVREVCLEKYASLKNSDSYSIVFFSKTLSSKAINGGAGDRDTDQYVGIRQNGWVMYEIVTEISGIGGPTRSERTREVKLSDQELENYFNGPNSSLGELHGFINKYNEIASLSDVSLSKIDVFFENL